MNASKFQNNLCNFLTFAYSGVKTYQQYLLNSIVNVIVQIFRYCLREHAIKVFATLSLCPDSTAVPRHGVDYQELLCPDRRAVAVRGKDVAGYEAATFDNSFYRRMSHDLEQFPGFIHPSCMILRPVPDPAVQDQLSVLIESFFNFFTERAKKETLITGAAACAFFPEETVPAIVGAILRIFSSGEMRIRQ